MSGTSIFDSVMGDIVPFADAALGATGAVAKSNNSGGDLGDATVLRSLRLEQAITNNKTTTPYGPQSFQAGKSQQTPSANPEVINQQWLQRLSRYSTMPQFEGARAKGA
jgi:hypothetical protein